MKLLKPLPPNRSYDQIKNHYLLEKSIAKRLKNSTREERTLILSTMYDEIFSKVPDHPRLTKRRSEELTSRANKNKLSLVNKFLNPLALFVEFGPGDCRFVFEVAKKVKFSYAVDIYDQRNPTDNVPENFNLIIYDGYNLEDIETNSIDLVFSDQLIEHIHEEDTKLHFELVHRILKKGGKYVFRTPHKFTGPHDISKFFSYEPEGFHLKEWTYTEINKLLMDLEYSRFHTYWNARGLNVRLPNTYFNILELALGIFPKRYIRSVTRYLIPVLCGVAVK
jgi:SAM-dependent methyltransferase